MKTTVKTLLKSVRQYKKPSLITPIFMALEAFCECLIPYFMAQMISESVGINAKGNMTFGNADCVELAKQYGTPLYVFDEVHIRKNCREFKASIDEFYDGNGMAMFVKQAEASWTIWQR